MSDEERQTILKQHATVYDGYATGNVTSNMTPLTVYDAARDKEGVTVDNLGNVKTYRNHNINEITAKPLNYDEIDPAYEFDSDGPLATDGMFEEMEDEGKAEQVKESIKESLDWFRRFTKFN